MKQAFNLRYLISWRLPSYLLHIVFRRQGGYRYAPDFIQTFIEYHKNKENKTLFRTLVEIGHSMSGDFV